MHKASAVVSYASIEKDAARLSTLGAEELAILLAVGLDVLAEEVLKAPVVQWLLAFHAEVRLIREPGGALFGVRKEQLIRADARGAERAFLGVHAVGDQKP